MRAIRGLSTTNKTGSLASASQVFRGTEQQRGPHYRNVFDRNAAGGGESGGGFGRRAIVGHIRRGAGRNGGLEAAFCRASAEDHAAGSCLRAESARLPARWRQVSKIGRASCRERGKILGVA